MLLIIFGAGASYDSSEGHLDFRPVDDANRHRPPLANQLFDDRFFEQMGQHAECAPLFARLRRLNTESGPSIEQELENIRDEGERYRHVARQMIELRSYLKDVIRVCVNVWAQHTAHIDNYATLLDRVAKWRSDNDESVAFVTFNYDTLLDQALSRGLYIELNNSVDAYIASPRYKLFKLHGSVDWVRKVVGYVSWRTEQSSVLQWIDEFRKDASSGGSDAAYYLPAIAVPVVNKSDFECPTAHIEQLKTILPDVDRVLVVGWRAMETHFLELWSSVSNITPKRIHVVAGSDGEEVVHRLASAGIASGDTGHSEGFSKFLLEERLRGFLHD
ncbi:MAG: SIR2 family protein [Chloroflexi bacterium]|nr:SIR2 family protein [Chloroflexota bacterium]